MTSAPRPKPSALLARAASAGTGKTTAIVGDVLRSLEDTPLRRVAVVTFTQAGAADLRLRLEAGLNTLLETGSYFDYQIYPTLRPRFEAARLELGGATVTTIHGFFRKLLRLCAPDLGLDPEFENTDELEADALFLDAAVQILSETVFREGTPGKRTVAELGWDGTLEALSTLRHSRAYSPYSAQGPLETELLLLYQRVAERTWNRQGGRSLDPDDVEAQTLRLTEFPELLERVRGRYHRLLIDEFQDVNPLQAQIFERLSLRHTQMVGDPKQSIYAFRNADVDAFLRLYSGAGKLSQLSHSYRHGPRLARLYSELAGRFFPDFAEAGIYNHVEGRGQDAFEQPLELTVVEAPTLDAGRRAEAHLLAARFLELHSAGWPWQDMAVLIRTRSSLEMLSAGLQGAGIPFVVQGGSGFYARREVRDAALLLAARGQAGRWLEEGPRPEEAGLLAALGRLPTLAVAPRARGQAWSGFLEANPALRALLEQIERAPRESVPYLRQLWETLPLEGGDRAAAENLRGLLRDLAQRGLSDPAAAARFLESARNARESSEPLEESDAVRILTVHSSKGLEFPVVAVYDLSRESAGQRGRVVVHPLEHSLTLRGSEAYRRTLRHFEAREEGESLRLLYVALTRPKALLLLTGTLSGRQARGWLKTLEPFLRTPPPECRVVYVAADELSPHSQPPSGPPDTQPQAASSGAAPQTHTPPRSSAEQRFAQQRLERPPTYLISPSRTVSSAAHLPRSTHDLPAIPEIGRVLGVLSHAAIAAQLAPEQVGTLRTQLILAPYPPEERGVLLEETRVLLEHYAHLYPPEQVRARSEDHFELPFTFAEGGRIWNGLIDRLYRENDTWVLEDYKTDSPPLEALETVARHYAPQLAVYREAVRRARGFTPTVRLCFLRLETQVILEDDTLEAAWLQVVRGEAGDVLEA